MKNVGSVAAKGFWPFFHSFSGELSSATYPETSSGCCLVAWLVLEITDQENEVYHQSRISIHIQTDAKTWKPYIDP